jgi:hypothetical protein
MKIRPVAAELFHADGQTDRTKLTRLKTQLTCTVVMDKPNEIELSFHQFLAVITGTEHVIGLWAKLYMCHGMISRITVKPLSIVPVTVVRPHVSSALFGPEISPI